MIKSMLGLMKSMALLSLWPACSFSRSEGEPEALHYRPLNGTTLREIADKKLHHGSDGVFRNPFGERRQLSRLGSVLYWKLFSPNQFKPYLKDQPTRPVRIDWPSLNSSKGVSVTFVKHSCVSIRDGSRHLIIDPVFFPIFRFIEDFTPIAFDLKRMPIPDHVLLTHGHYDHLDKPSLSVFPKDTHLISPLGYDDIITDLKMTNLTPLDWFDTHSDGKWEITLLPCNHWTMRNPIIGPNRSLWGSYLVRTPSGATIYLSGDIAWFDGFAEIGNLYDIDLAIFNLGAYEPRWFMAPSHVNPEETVRAFKDMNAKKVMIVHWGTFQLGDEPVHFPPMDFEKVLEKENLMDLWVRLGHGETYFL